MSDPEENWPIWYIIAIVLASFALVYAGWWAIFGIARLLSGVLPKLY